MEKKMAEFIVNLHPLSREREETENADISVGFGGAYVHITAPEDTTYGMLEKVAVEYFKPFHDVKPTEIRTVGYAGPV